MMKHIVFAVCGLFFLSCSQQVKETNSTADTVTPNESTSIVKTQPALPQSIESFYQPAGDSVVLPPFSIELNLSEKAEEKLTNANETVIVSADFQGKPRDTTDKFFQQWGYIVVANGQVELQSNRIATFDKLKISKSVYDKLASKDVDVLIDVFSGRRSSQNNFLSCESLQEPISKVRKQTNVLSGKLIGE